MRAQHAVALFLLAISERPWAAPSIPVAELSNAPSDEVRRAELPVDREGAVSIWYRHRHGDGQVDVLEVTGS